MPAIQGWAVAGKSWAALAGSLLTLLVPLILRVADLLPPPWPEVIGAVIAVLTAFGVYQAPYQPVGGSSGSTYNPPQTPPNPSSPWPTS